MQGTAAGDALPVPLLDTVASYAEFTPALPRVS